MTSTNNKDSLILPPERLGRQTCWECHKYLSVGPVVVTRGGKTICGRCNTNSSLYDQVVENCLFPCVNYKAGCQELLPYNEAKDHEANCSKSAIISCPFGGYKGDERELVRHFKEDHSEYIVDNIFELIPEDGYSRNLIFLNDQHILCLTVVTRYKFFKIYNTLLTPSFSKFTHFTLSFFKLDDNHGITFRIRIMHNSKDFPVDADANCEEEVDNVNYVQLENCFLVSHDYLVNCLHSDSYYCEVNYVDNQSRGLEVSKQKLGPPQICLEKNFMKYLDRVPIKDFASLRQLSIKRFLELSKCVRCEKYMTFIDCFICPKEHFVCNDCVDMKCPKCESFVYWNCPYKHNNILLNCVWNCQQMIKISDYREHVRFCKARLYKCPDKNCQYIGLLGDFKKHWHLNQLRCSNPVIFKWKECAFFWLLPTYQELVYVTFDITSDNNCLITIHEDYALIPELYTFEVLELKGRPAFKSLQNSIGRYQGLIHPSHANVSVNVRSC